LHPHFQGAVNVAANGAITARSSTAVLWKLRTGVPWRDLIIALVAVVVIASLVLLGPQIAGVVTRVSIAL
jgi:ABC-type uncharacterized transport system permease subunit